MNPYEADTTKVPDGDKYFDCPLYGRYLPKPGDFRPDPAHVLRTTPEAINYWKSVLDQCTADVRLYENPEDGREVFALGSTIIKSRHLKKAVATDASLDFSYSDTNELKTVGLVKQLDLGDVKIPEIFFAGQIDGRPVLVQERIPGVGLNVAWKYLSPGQKASFKAQARDLMRKIARIKPKVPAAGPSYVNPDPDPVSHRGIQELEFKLLFDNVDDLDLGLMHNDVQPSNIIVNDDRIVGIVDWEMSGFFGWKRAGDVHVQIRSPKRENYANLDLDEAFLDDIMYWSDLYKV